MKKIVIAAAVGLLAIAPAFAQGGPSTEYAAGTSTGKLGGHNWPKPVDHGPYTAAANKAYQGGGMILQGARRRRPNSGPSPSWSAKAGHPRLCRCARKGVVPRRSPRMTGRDWYRLPMRRVTEQPIQGRCMP